MRGLTERDGLRRFMQALGDAAATDTRVYFTGGACAVLLGWRASTIDVDLQLVPDRDDVLRAIASLKDRLQINVELVAPSHFIPELPGWETRSVFIAREGRNNRLGRHHLKTGQGAVARRRRRQAGHQARSRAVF